MSNQFFVDSEHLSPAALEKKHRLETDPSSRKSHMEYLPGMEIIQSDVCQQVLSQMNSFDYSSYTARDLVNAGAASVMPLASPIGSNKGLATREFIQILIDEIDLPIIVDAGIGRPSQACEAMEMGAAAIMANTALATAGDLPLMAAAFRQAIEAGRKAYLSGLGRVLTRGASASDPLTGFLRD